MLEVDTRASAFRSEAHLNLGEKFCAELPLRCDLPCQDDLRWWLPGQYLSPLAFQAVVSALEPSAAGARLDSFIGARVGLIENAGLHHRPILDVKASKASFWEVCTRTDRRIGSATFDFIAVFSAWLLREIPLRL